MEIGRSGRSRARRTITRVIVLLVLGAIINIAVAWGCAAFPTFGRFGLSDRLIEECDEGGQVVHTFLDANEAGWPLRALSCDRHQEGLPLSFDFLYKLGIKEGDTLPIRPIAAGFAINTLFYASILWLLFIAPFALRRRFIIRRRIKRGLCPICAYPVGENAVCTECGVSVETPKVA